ncbi:MULTISPECIES: hypothetical protein [unclassified Arthrobacter]|uniref:hypothetical protein n=1 Tax=unclassified Arthrobacter TaxID=235627 RepID=UPI0006F2F327|nr:hypothetical protein [Arthrobacter sp. Soil764]KRE83363.1 hypothetical protein ASG86_09120 [Arthrobacter sp. Soil764]
MADQHQGKPRRLRTSVKGPLMFSAFWAVVAFVAVLIFASGGSARAPRFDLAFTAAGIAFIATLVVAAMLSMSYKENAEHLGKGSGVNLSSAPKRPSQAPPGHGFGAPGSQNPPASGEDTDGTPQR